MKVLVIVIPHKIFGSGVWQQIHGPVRQILVVEPEQGLLVFQLVTKVILVLEIKTEF